MDYVKALGRAIEGIYDDIEAEAEAKDGRATSAIVKDANHVTIGSQTYPAALAADVYMTPGSTVWVQVTGEGVAVIIGD